MINAPDYRRATNAAYNLLIKQEIMEIPVNLNSLLQLYQKHTRLATYAKMAARFYLTLSEYKEYAPSEFGFTLKKGYKNYILYNEEKGYHTNRFTIAHEIGHIELGHKIDNSVADREANCFARNLLCPVPVIDSFQVSCIKDYVGWFHISDLMAKNCIKNVTSDRYYIEDCLYSTMNDLLYTFMTGESLVSAYGYSYC